MIAQANSADAERARKRFPALDSPTIFLENAGGSQVPQSVIDRMTAFLTGCNVQLGATYAESREATAIVHEAHRLLNRFVGGEGAGTAFFAASSSQAISALAQAYGDVLQPGDKVVIAENGHEANVTPWLRLAKSGVEIVWWKVDAEAMDCTLAGLRDVLDSNVRLVVYPHVSNLLGAIAPVEEINQMAHAVGAKVVVDGVAFAPHGLVDVVALDCDFYVFSIYKVFGPHLAGMYGSNAAFESLTGPNHGFIPRDALPYKWELGCLNHEGCAGWLGVGDYVLDCLGVERGSMPTRAQIEAAWQLWSAWERPLTEALVTYLAAHPKVRLIGPQTPEGRFGIVSFVHESLPSEAIVAKLVAGGVACRNGHMYSLRLCQALGIDAEQGVVRLSLLHYNSPEEIARTIEILDQTL